MDRVIVQTLNEKVNDFRSYIRSLCSRENIYRVREGNGGVDSIPLLMTKRIMSIVSKTWRVNITPKRFSFDISI